MLGIALMIKNKENKFYPYLLWAGLYLLAYLIVNVDAYAWYFIPLVPIFVAISAYGIIKIDNILKKAIKNRIVSASFISIICLLILATSALGCYHYINKVDSNWANYKYIGLWLNDNTEKNNTIMTGAFHPCE